MKAIKMMLIYIQVSINAVVEAIGVVIEKIEDKLWSTLDAQVIQSLAVDH
jgi:hypothetical protein